MATTQDEDDVLAPGSSHASDMDGEPEADDGTGRHGFADAAGIVRLWFDEDRLTRVRVSSRWREKVRRSTLEACFAEAIAAANLRVADVPVREDPSFEDADFSGLPPVSPRSLSAFNRLFVDLQRRWDEALERRDAAPPTAHPSTTGRSRGVTVTLDGGGRLSRVSLDANWLEGVESAVAIRGHVVRAWERARAQFTPAPDHQAKLLGFEAEHRLLLTAFTAMLNPKERS